jgi:hypothetical protein
MSAVFGALRKNLLTPSLDDVTFAKRGFPAAATAESRYLESIPQHVILGFEFGIEFGDRPQSLLRLGMVERDFRGFAYEGATMAFTLLDVMPGRRSDRTKRFLDGNAAPHLFVAYIGIGFAMSHLPRVLWSKVLPELKDQWFHPRASWLAVDGHGFDQAYFNSKKWIDGQRVPKPYSWQGRPEYFVRAFDQGIGRMLWFMHGASPSGVASAISAFASHRHADLWSGIGVAAAYAGAGDPEMFKVLREVSGEYLPELAQGVVFAAKARIHEDLETPHTEVATRVVCDMTLSEASDITDEASDLFVGERESLPDYELWRRKVQDRFR